MLRRNLRTSFLVTILVTGTLTGAVLASGPDYWLSGRDWSLEADPEFQYSYERGAAPWLFALEEGGVVHLLFEFPAKILRYDMNTETWLADIDFGISPTAMAIDAEGLYVAFGSVVNRYALDGSGETLLYTSPNTVREMLVDGSLLFLSDFDKMESVDKGTGALLDSADFFYSIRGLSIARSTDIIYGRSIGVGPSDIVSVAYAVNGTLGTDMDSPFHGDYPDADQTWVFPGDQFVSDTSGVTYTGSLGYGGSLAGALNDLAFHPTGVIARRGGELFAHGLDFLETGRFSLSDPVSSMFVQGGSIYGFFSSIDGADAVEVPLSSLVPLTPGPPVDPTGLVYAPDEVLVDETGVVHLLSNANLSIFRWSRDSQSYLPSISLVEEAQQMAYSAANDQLYLAYPNGKVTAIDVPGVDFLGGFSESPLLNSPQQPCGLSTAGPWIFLCDPSGAWVSHFTYSPAGALISQEEWNYFSQEYAWSGANGKMYHLRDDTIPNDLLWEEIDLATGEIGVQIDSPAHSSLGMMHPIRVHPAGQIVLLGSGRYHNATSLALIDELGTALVDGEWLGNQLVTLHADGGGSELRFWNEFLAAVVDTVPLPGAPLRLLRAGGDLIAVTSVGGTPEFTVVGVTIFVDGFESGDTSAWSLTAP